jgi:F0F1-type ATP synthase assembly protein I
VSATDTTQQLVSDVRRSTGGFELVLSPLLLALIGFGLDRLFGITPVLTVLFAVVGFAGAVTIIVIGYDREMGEHADGAAWKRLESDS